MAEAYARELDAALQAVRVASRVCRNVQGAIAAGVMDKEDRTPVTVADFASQAVICRAIAEVFPSDPIIGEEDSAALGQPENRPFLERIRRELSEVGIDAGDDTVRRWIDKGNADVYSDRFWTLDPIDGTKGFVRGEQYAISLALIVDGRIDIGVLGCPNLSLRAGSAEPRGAIFYAVRGGGAWVVPLDGDPDEERIAASGVADPAAARFCESVESGHSAHGRSARVAQLLGITRAPLRMDSQAKYAAVARGEAEIYLRLPTRADYTENIWDHAGGVLVVEEAGGVVTDMQGQPLEFTHGPKLAANRGLVVANRALHARVVEAIRGT